MSIYGPPDLEEEEEVTNVDLSEYTKKIYVDTQDSIHVLKAGDTMTGDLNMSENNIRGLPVEAPVGNDAAVSWKQCVDLVVDAVNEQVSRDGDTMSGNLDMSNVARVINCLNPVNPQDVATKAYIDNSYILKDGDTMTGNLVMSNSAKIRGLSTEIVENDEDEALSSARIQSKINISSNLNVSKSGDTMSGDLNMGNSARITNCLDPVNSQDVVTKTILDQNISNVKPIITVWAERNGQLISGAYEWAFADSTWGFRRMGYTMMSSGRVLRMAITAINKDGDDNDYFITSPAVAITVNGSQTNYAVQKSNAEPATVVIFSTPLELSMGDTINFVTTSFSSASDGGIVSILIELDI